MLPPAIWRTIPDEELLSEFCRRLPHLTDERCEAMEHVTRYGLSLAQKWRERMNPERAQRAFVALAGLIAVLEKDRTTHAAVQAVLKAFR